MIYFRNIHVFFLCCFFSLTSRADGNVPPGNTVNGYVKDARNGEMLVGATVAIKGTGQGTVTNVYGFFSLDLPVGENVLQFGFLGYNTFELEVNNSRRVTIELQPKTQTIAEVVVKGEGNEGSSRFPLLGLEKMESSSISNIPVLMGETDPMKAIQMLPGVSATSEGSSNFTVRGGNPDQNLLLMDEAIVYNAGHLLGFFSVFNNDAIKNIQLYKGDFPASEGGRLSSVLDVRTRDGNMKYFEGSAGIGLISSRLNLEGPISKDKASFLVSGRRTYLDLFLPLAEDEEIRNNKLYFYDANVKINWIAGDKDRFFLSGYMGRDLFKDELAQLDFGNNTFTFRWNHVFSPSLFSNFSFVRSGYDYFLGTSEKDIEDMEWVSEFNDYMFGADFSWFITPEHTLRYGLRSIYHRIDPGVVSGMDENSLFQEVDLPRNNSLEHGIYFSHTAELSPWMILRMGLRYSVFQNIGPGKSFVFDEYYEVTDTVEYSKGNVYNTYVGLEPRAGISIFFNPRLSGKMSYSRTRQYIQLASNSTSSTPLDVWFPSSPNIKPQIADQVSLGFFKTSRNGVFEHSLEVFNKWMQNTIDFKDHPNLILNETLEGEVRAGTSWARGFEIMTRWNTIRFKGWLGYTFLKSERVAPEINEGRPFLSPYDHTHDFSLFMNYRLSTRVSVSGNWVYYTGAPVTMPVGRYEVDGEFIPLYSERNAERMPDYHRLDLSMTIDGKRGGQWVFSIYNVYGRKNPWAINFVNEDGEPYNIKAEKTYLFSIVPSISYTLEF
ncbi:TonB-dependent receptor [Marinilabilia rubra]|uniref:TonB-dependent receptor n=1 Tax=Marinilabilia rubra TaxID=2162893 RepID=A0A2U2BA60_9BACT|nr:TonB-dependent receptor [Marinilabilia rubra]PWD99959.1 TonB-dependent receptor [Marinilabilia rubra]